MNKRTRARSLTKHLYIYLDNNERRVKNERFTSPPVFAYADLIRAQELAGDS